MCHIVHHPSSDLTNGDVVDGVIVAPPRAHLTPQHNTTRVNSRFTDLPKPPLTFTCRQQDWELLKILYHSAVFACVKSDTVHVGNISLNRLIFKE